MPGDDDLFDYDRLEGPDVQEVLGGVWHNDDTAGVFIHGPDARLISLAPEMAELLVQIAEQMGHTPEPDSDLEWLSEGQAHTIKKAAEELLARARGEA